MLEFPGAHLPVVLLDQDGPLAQWEPAMNSALLEIDASFPVVDPVMWDEFYFYRSLPEHAKTLRMAYQKPGFYRNLEPVPGSVEAVREMSEYVNVVVATRPMFENEFCESDKKWWLRKHHGGVVVVARRSNYVYDKTLLRGKFIIEDHPSPAENGLAAPEWTQIVFAGGRSFLRRV